MPSNGRHAPSMIRRVNVETIETARIEKGLTRLKLCAKANIDPQTYRLLLQYHGEHSRDRVLLQVASVLGLKIRDLLTFSTTEGSNGRNGA